MSLKLTSYCGVLVLSYIQSDTVFADTQSLPNCRSNVNSKVNTITAAPPWITTGLNTPYMTICDNRWSYWG